MSHGTDQRADLDTGTDSLADAFYPLYQRAFDDDSDFVADVAKKLAQARMAETPELFLSKALGIGVITGVALWLVGMLAGYGLATVLNIGSQSLIGLPVQNEQMVGLLNAAKVPGLIVVSGVIFGTVGFATGFGGLVAIPYSKASARTREINMLLPDAVSFMYALSIGGLNQLEILEAMARADDTYGEVAYEFRSIVQETEYFDTDYRTSIRNHAMETPSDDLSQFLTDMLSIINSGGDMTDFLSDKKDKHMRTAQQQQEQTLDTLELFGEMYMTLSLFPLLLVIIIVIMSMMGSAQQMLLYGTVYALIPLTGVGFLVMISTVKQDEPGDGYLRPEGSDRVSKDPGLLNLGLVEDFTGGASVFDRIRSREGTHATVQLLKQPHYFFRDHPLYTLALTVPAVLAILGAALATGSAPTMWDGLCVGNADALTNTVACGSKNVALNADGTKQVVEAGFIQQPVWSTFIYVYVPIYVVGFPLAVFRAWNNRSRKGITANLSDNLRKLSSANDTGQTLLESIKTVADTSTGRLGREFEVMHAKVNYGMSLKEALREFNNKYHIPRLARTVKLISKAQEASSEITAVLTTAAQASENQDDIERERKTRTQMQIVIIIMTYLTLLAVMAILKTQFLDVMSQLAGQASGSSSGGSSMSFGASINTNLLSLLFFHAVTLQSVLSGFISGYIRDAELLSGVKYVVVLATIALAVWMVIG